MLAATVTNAVMASSIHYLAAEMHAFEIAFFRSLLGSVILAPLLLRRGLSNLRTRHLPLHTLRAGINVIAMLTYYLGLALIPLAEVMAINFSAPLFCAALAIVLLGERASRGRIAALLAGFAATMIVIQPGTAAFDPQALVVLFSALMWGASMVVIKVLSQRDSSTVCTFWFSTLVLPFTFAAALFHWTTPTAGQIGWLIVIGVFGTLSTVCLTEAFRRADATLVMPIDFCKLIWGSLIGIVFFSEPISLLTWIGAPIIVGAATYSSYLGARDNRREGLVTTPLLKDRHE